MNSRFARSGALLAAASLALLPTAAQSADPVVAQSGANALTLSIGGNAFSTGSTVATHDGKKQTKQGEVEPPISVLQGQGLLNVGALVQDAETEVTNRNGTSEACAGVAGNGAGVATVGDSQCITPGDPVGISIANLDLTGTVLIDPDSAVGALAPLNAIGDQLLGPITAAVTEGLAPFGNVSLGGTLGAVESRCQADRTTATGTANIADTELGLAIEQAGIDVVLAKLPVNPPPNTKVITDLAVVIDTITNAVETQLNDGLDGLAAPLATVVDQVQTELVDAIIGQIAPQLAPLEENILDITLNKQTFSEGGKRILVTAIDLKLLPAASEFGFDSLVGAEIASSTCGPNGRVAPSPTPTPTPEPTKTPTPEVPTIVDAGAAGPVSDGPGSPLLWGMVAVTLAGTGAVAGRRLLQR